MHSGCRLAQERAAVVCDSVYPLPPEPHANRPPPTAAAPPPSQSHLVLSSCLGFLSAHIHIGQCLQELLAASCDDKGAPPAAAAPRQQHDPVRKPHLPLSRLLKYAVRLDHALMLESFHARYGYFFESSHPLAPLHHLPRCLDGRFCSCSFPCSADISLHKPWPAQHPRPSHPALSSLAKNNVTRLSYAICPNANPHPSAP